MTEQITPGNEEIKPLARVFISYCWTNEAYCDRILQFANRLVAQSSIDVVIDRWDLRAGQDKNDFMEQMVKDDSITKVLIMCDEEYAKRANNREKGVGVETTIISQEVYINTKQEKFIPIIMERDADGNPFLPIYIKSRIYIDLSDEKHYEENYEQLWQTITGRHKAVKPPLGRAPAYLMESEQPTSPTTYAFRSLENALINDRRNTSGLAAEYLERLTDEVRQLQVDTDNNNTTSVVGKAMLDSLDRWIPLRQEYTAFVELACRFNQEERLLEGVVPLLESVLQICEENSHSPWHQHMFYVRHELFLATMTALLNRWRFGLLNTLLNTQYRGGNRLTNFYDYGIFSRGETNRIDVLLNERWNEKLGNQNRNVRYMWLYEQAEKHKFFTVSTLREAEIVLWLRFKLREDPDRYNLGYTSWKMFLSPSDYLEDFLEFESGSFPLFRRATSREFFEKFKLALGVASKEEFLHSWEKHFPEHYAGRKSHRTELLERVLNVRRLASQT